ncbi:MAG TPA: hypothetical protein VHF25_07505 [Nitriliruptorales bacterium]|nr:hypothetical protein [Nitriliruptorales bacterium]
MNELLVAAGLALVLATAADVVPTVFDVGRGGGPVTGRTCMMLWRLVLRARRRGLSHRGVETCGVIILLSVVTTWVVGLWAGWFLTFSADRASLVVEATGDAASALDRAYFVGGGLFSLSLGDVRPGGPGWRLAAVGMVASGLLIIMLSITYLVPVVEAATRRRELAGRIAVLGASPESVVLAAWDGSSTADLGEHLRDLLPDLMAVAQQHLAYPVLHFFHAARRTVALAPNVAVLDEALGIIEHGLRPEVGPDPVTLRAIRGAVDELVTTLRLHLVGDPEPPPTPDLDALRGERVPLTDAQDFRQAMGQAQERRRGLKAMVEEDGWDWKDVVAMA